MTHNITEQLTIQSRPAHLLSLLYRPPRSPPPYMFPLPPLPDVRVLLGGGGGGGGGGTWDFPTLTQTRPHYKLDISTCRMPNYSFAPILVTTNNSRTLLSYTSITDFRAPIFPSHLDPAIIDPPPSASPP